MYARRTRRTTIVAFIVAQITATSIYALASDGPGLFRETSPPISGLQVENVDYELDRENPHFIERLSFRAKELPTGADVKIRLSEAGEWFGCTTAGEMAICETPGTTVASVTRLSVVVAG